MEFGLRAVPCFCEQRRGAFFLTPQLTKQRSDSFDFAIQFHNCFLIRVTDRAALPLPVHSACAPLQPKCRSYPRSLADSDPRKKPSAEFVAAVAATAPKPGGSERLFRIVPEPARDLLSAAPLGFAPLRC